MNDLTYVAIGREDVVLSKTEKFPSSKKYNFTFRATTEMMPNAKIIVYYIREDGEIISDYAKIDLGYKLQNRVS